MFVCCGLLIKLLKKRNIHIISNKHDIYRDQRDIISKKRWATRPGDRSEHFHGKLTKDTVFLQRLYRGKQKRERLRDWVRGKENGKERLLLLLLLLCESICWDFSIHHNRKRNTNATLLKVSPIQRRNWTDKGRYYEEVFKCAKSSFLRIHNDVENDAANEYDGNYQGGLV